MGIGDILGTPYKCMLQEGGQLGLLEAREQSMTIPSPFAAVLNKVGWYIINDGKRNALTQLLVSLARAL